MTAQNVVVNVKDFGAVGDGKSFRDGNIASGTTNFYSASASFNSNDQAKNILVVGAGGSGANLVTTISEVTNATTVKLVAPAIDTVSNAATVVWRTDDAAAITTAVNSIPSSGGTLLFPTSAGSYVVTRDITIPSAIQITFEEGAVLTPSSAAVIIQGRVTAHPMQQIFGGTGVNGSVTQSGGGPIVTPHGDPRAKYASFIVKIVAKGTLGTATFKYSVNKGSSWSATYTTAKTFILPATGVTLAFDVGTYVADTIYMWDAWPPITVTPLAFEHFNVRHWGAKGDWDDSAAFGTDNADAFEAAFAAMSAAGSSKGTQLVIPPGDYWFSRTPVQEKGANVIGLGGGTGNGVCRIRTAPGVSGWRFEYSGTFTSPSGASAELAKIEHLDFLSTPLSNFPFAALLGFGIYNRLSDHPYPNGFCVVNDTRTVSGTADAGDGKITVATSSSHGLATGTKVRIHGVNGTVAANGMWTVTKVDDTRFTLDGSDGKFDSAWTSGGTIDVNPNIFFRNSVHGGRSSSGGTPAEFRTAALRDPPIKDGTAVWIAESFVVPRPRKTCVRVGFRYYVVGNTFYDAQTNADLPYEDDNRRYFECIEAGTTADTTNIPAAAAEGQMLQQFIDGTEEDGATFQVRTHSGIECYAPQAKIEHMNIQGFGNCAVFLEGVANIQAVTYATRAAVQPIVLTAKNHGWYTGQKVSVGILKGNTAANGQTFTVTRLDADRIQLNDSPAGGPSDWQPGGTQLVFGRQSSVDMARVTDVFGTVVGCNLYVGTSDANGVHVQGVNSVNSGIIWGDRNGQAGILTGTVDVTFSGGGHNVHDHSQGLCTFISCYAQNGTGRGVLNRGNRSVFIGCGSENHTPDKLGSGCVVMAGSHGSGRIEGPNALILEGKPSNGRGLQFLDDSAASVSRGRFLLRDLGYYDGETFDSWTTDKEAGGSRIWFKYDSVNGVATLGKGTYGFVFFGSNLTSAATLGFTGPSSPHGMGLLRNYNGQMTGRENVSGGDAVQHWEGYSNHGLATKQVRRGRVRAGDDVKFPDQVTPGVWRKYVALTDGWRGNWDTSLTSAGWIPGQTYLYDMDGTGIDITGATNERSIVITTATAHGLSTGMERAIWGVGGNTAANGVWVVEVLTPTTFRIPVSGVRAGTYAANTGRLEAGAMPADMVEPTVNEWPLPAAGRFVFRLLKNGSATNREPAWVTTTPGVSQTTDAGGRIWLYMGTVPTYGCAEFLDDPSIGHSPQTQLEWKDTSGTALAGAAPQASVRSYRAQATTTSSGEQVLFRRSDLLPNCATSIVDVTITAKRSESTDGGSAKLSGTFFRGGDTVTGVGTIDNNSKLSSNLAGLTFELNVLSGAGMAGDIEIRASPPSSPMVLCYGIFVQVSSITDLIIIGGDVSVAGLATHTFSASGGDGNYTWSLETNASHGSIIGRQGRYTAGYAWNGKADVVKVTDGQGNTATVKVTLTVPQLPTIGTPCRLQLDAERGITLVSGKVSRWADQTGTCQDFTDTGASALRPILTSDALNSLHGITFNGLNSLYTASDNISKIFGITKFTMLVVWKYAGFFPESTSVAYGNPAIFADFSNSLGIYVSSTHIMTSQYSEKNAKASVSAGIPCYSLHYHDGDNVYVQTDQDRAVRGSSAGSRIGDGACMCVGVNGNPGPSLIQHFVGDVYEIICYPDWIGATDLLTIQKYAAAKWFNSAL